MMWEPCNFNDVEGIEQALKRGANPNATDRDGNTALLLCAERGFAESMDFLLRKCKCDVNAQVNARMHKCSNAQALNAQMHKCTNGQMHKCSNAQVLNAQMHKYTNAKCTNAQVLNAQMPNAQINAKCANAQTPE